MNNFTAAFNSMDARRASIDQMEFSFVQTRLTEIIYKMKRNGFKFKDFMLKDVMLTPEEKADLVSTMGQDTLQWRETEYLEVKIRTKLREYLINDTIFEVRLVAGSRSRSANRFSIQYDSIETIEICEFNDIHNSPIFQAIPNDYTSDRLYATRQKAEERAEHLTKAYQRGLEEIQYFIEGEQEAIVKRLEALRGGENGFSETI